MLHLTPPMSAPDELRQCKKLVNEAGYLEVHNDTLQSTRYPNIFSIGDCSSAPTSKTAAAVGMYSVHIHENSSLIFFKIIIYHAYSVVPRFKFYILKRYIIYIHDDYFFPIINITLKEKLAAEISVIACVL